MIKLFFSTLLLFLLVSILSLPIALYLNSKLQLSKISSLIYAIFVELFIIILILNLLLNFDYKVLNFIYFIFPQILFNICIFIWKKRVLIKFLAQLYLEVNKFKYSILVILVCLLLISSLSSFDMFNFSMIQRVGPDANGSLAGARFLTEGGTLGELRNNLTSQLKLKNLDEIFNLKNIYLLPSTTDQIINEFLLGSVRYNYSGLISIIKLLLTNLTYFEIASSLNSLLLLLLGFLTLIIFENSKNIIYIIAPTLTITHPLSLNLLFEGSLTHYFLVIYLLLIFSILKQNIPTFYVGIFFAIFCFSSILIYPDSIFIILGFVVIITLFRWSVIDGLKIFKSFLFSFTIIALLAFNFLSNLADWLSRRLIDNSQGGWGQTFFPDISSLLSLSNPIYPFSSYTLNAGIRQIQLSIFLNFILLLILFCINQDYISRKLNRTYNAILTYSLFLLILSALYIEFLNLTNYQLYKFMGSFSIILLVIFIAKVEDLYIRNFYFFIFGLILFFMFTMTRATYFYDFISNDRKVPNYINSLTNEKYLNIISTSNIIAPTNFGSGGLGIWNLSVVTNVNHINRNPSIYEKKFESVFDLNKPLLILFEKNSCSGEKCAELFLKNNVIQLNSNLYAIQFSKSSKFLNGVKIGQISEIMFNSETGLAYKL